MWIKVLKSKVHRATVTHKDLRYNGSITVDQDLLDKAGLRVHEQVLVANLSNGTRHETYVLAGRRGSGHIALNGAAARLGEVGDQVIVMGFAYVTPEEADALRPKVVRVNERNQFAGYFGAEADPEP